MTTTKKTTDIEQINKALRDSFEESIAAGCDQGMALANVAQTLSEITDLEGSWDAETLTFAPSEEAR